MTSAKSFCVRGYRKAEKDEFSHWTITECDVLAGDVIVLGKSDVFKFNFPTEAAKLREKRRSGLYGMVSSTAFHAKFRRTRDFTHTHANTYMREALA